MSTTSRTRVAGAASVLLSDRGAPVPATDDQALRDGCDGGPSTATPMSNSSVTRFRRVGLAPQRARARVGVPHLPSGDSPSRIVAMGVRIALGPDAFARAVAGGDRSRRGRGGTNGAGNGHGGDGNGAGHGWAPRPAVAIPVVAEAAATSLAVIRRVPRVSPLRGGAVTGTIEIALPGGPAPFRPRPPVPVGEPQEPVSIASLTPESAEATPWPDEALPGQQLHVRFGAAPQETVVGAFQTLRELFGQRLGETQVVLHIPAGPGRVQEMQLRSGVAFDAELISDVRRRLGTLVELRLG